MPYVLVEDFRGGVDRRRPIHALKPGTLWECVNAHITNGGDIEKRKAFVDQGEFSSDTFGLAAAGELLYTFGSVAPGTVDLPAGVQYQRLTAPYAGGMTGIVDWDLFTGKLYVIASFQDGSVRHFYDGALVGDWDNGVIRSPMGTLSIMAQVLAHQVNILAAGRYNAVPVGNVITITALVAGSAFTVQTLAENVDGGTDDQTLTNANVTPNTPAVTGVKASFTFSCQGGTGAGTVTSVRVGGVEILVGGPIAWATDNTNFAGLIAAALTGAGHSATSSGESVTVLAAATGTAENGLSVEVTTTGTARLGIQAAAGTSTIGTMSGGVAAVAGVAQVNTLTFGGIFQPGDRFGFTLTTTVNNQSVTDYFGNIALPFGNSATVKTHKRKIYAGSGGILDFSGVNDATAWNQDTDAGAGFLTASNHAGGSESITSLESYQGRLALFSRKVIQLWTMQNDDALNNPDQVIENTGTRSPRSTLEFGGNDVFYLDDSGINSLKARDASNNAFVSGVAASINKLVRTWMKGVTESDVERAASIVEPQEARFWMAISTRIFVYSFFPAERIAAWSWYEPGFTVTDFARTSNKVYARGDDGHLYLYGGSSGEDYDSSRVTVQFPFLTAGKPGNYKNVVAFNMAAEGTWECRLKINPNQLTDEVQLGIATGVTFNADAWGGLGHSTHIAPLMIHEAAEYATISQVALHYEGAEESV